MLTAVARELKRILDNISGRILLTVYAAMAVLCAYFIVSNHYNYSASKENEALHNLHSIAKTLSVQIEGDRLRRLLENYPDQNSISSNTQDPYYYVMHNNMQKAAELNGITQPIRTLTRAANGEYFIGASSESTPHFRQVFAGNTQALEQLYNTGGTLHLSGEGDQGPMLQALAPLQDRSGKTVAVLLLESPYELVASQLMLRLWRNIALAVAILVLVGIILFKSIRKLLAHEEANKKMLEEVNAIMKEKDQSMTDSIEYAAKVQKAIIPNPESLGRAFNDHFVLNKPKDILSGDFYWFHEINQNEYYIATVDCTGHGVPGAIMSAIGCSLLNEIVQEEGIERPGQLLTRLNSKLLDALHQHGKAPGAGDGMDIALCRIDKRSNKIVFSGAMRPLYWIHKNKLEVISGDRFPIGGSQYDPDRKFSDHHLHYDEGDKLYLFSDGYADQFGGPLNKKFMITQLNEFIEAHHHLPMADQCQQLDATFEAWRGDEEQVDDVCMVGVMV